VHLDGWVCFSCRLLDGIMNVVRSFNLGCERKNNRSPRKKEKRVGSRGENWGWRKGRVPKGDLIATFLGEKTTCQNKTGKNTTIKADCSGWGNRRGGGWGANKKILSWIKNTGAPLRTHKRREKGNIFNLYSILSCVSSCIKQSVCQSNQDEGGKALLWGTARGGGGEGTKRGREILKGIAKNKNERGVRG